METGAAAPENPAGPVGTPPQADLPAVLARIDERLAALEAAVGTEEAISRDELAKVDWAIRHGRKRPW